jgi:cobalamin synthase
MMERDSGTLRNRWNVVLLILVAAALVAGLALTTLPAGPLRETAFWLTILSGVLMIVAAVGWGYTEVRRQERLSQRFRTPRQRILSYLGVLIVVAAIAIGGAMVPSQLAPIVWTFYVPIWLVGGWWLRRASHRRHSRVEPLVGRDK